MINEVQLHWLRLLKKEITVEEYGSTIERVLGLKQFLMGVVYELGNPEYPFSTPFRDTKRWESNARSIT